MYMTAYPDFKAEKQTDGTYTIWLISAHTGSKLDVIKTGVRGCNVHRVIRTLRNAQWKRER